MKKIDYKKGYIWNNSLVHEYNDYIQKEPKNHELAYFLYSLLCEMEGNDVIDSNKVAIWGTFLEKRDEPFPTYKIHLYALENFPFFFYMIAVFFPLKILIGAYQMLNGRHFQLFEYGIYIIVSKTMRAILFSYVVFGMGMPALPDSYWTIYFKGLRYLLDLDEHIQNNCVSLTTGEKCREFLLLFTVFFTFPLFTQGLKLVIA
tara:strand:- start:6892 stop:7500 length:609 start_codon:yes stop_codon:yes gene_type:complete